jgi:hypothetical protein
MLGPPPQCVDCINWRPALDDLQARRTAGMDGLQLCAAYMAPPGIPDEIWFGAVDHRIPYTNDHGVQWSPRSPEIEFPEESLQPAGALLSDAAAQVVEAATADSYTDPGPETMGEERTLRLP